MSSLYCMEHQGQLQLKRMGTVLFGQSTETLLEKQWKKLWREILKITENLFKRLSFSNL